MSESGPGTLYERERRFREAVLRYELEQHGGNRTHTAAALGIPRNYLVRLLLDLGLQDYCRGTGGTRGGTHTTGASS